MHGQISARADEGVNHQRNWSLRAATATIAGLQPPEPRVAPASRPTRATRAAFFALLARAFRSGAKLIAFLVVARAYALDETGRFAYLVVLGSLAGGLADLGLSEYLVREVAARGPRAAALVQRAATVRIAGLLPAIGATWLLTGLLGDAGFTAGTLGCIAFGCCGTAADFLASERRAYGRLDLEALESAAGSLGPLVPASVVAVLGAPFAVFQIVLGGSALVLVSARLAWLIRRASRERRARTTADAAEESTLATLRGSRWFLAKAIVAWAIFESPVVYVARLASAAEVAIFTAALRPVALLPHPFLALSNAFMPALAHDHLQDRARFIATVRRLNLIGVAFVPAALAGCMILGDLLLRSFGAAYSRAWPTLVTLAIGYAIYLGIISGFPLVVRNRERAVVLASLVAFLVILLAVVVLIPAHGSVGAALAMVAGLLAAKVIHCLTYRSEELPLGGWRDLAVIVATGGWLAASLVSPPALALVLLVAGAAASMLLTWRLLHGTVLFQERNE